MQRLRKGRGERYNMGMEFQAKQATAAQADILGRIHAASWQAAYEGVVPEAERRRFTPERRAKIWSDFCRAAHRNAICFFEEGVPEDEGEVYAFYMHPSIWGTPATKWAFLFCLQRLKDMGYRSAVVWVLEENRRDRRFYEKHRFSSECVYQQIEIGAKLREMRYAKTL